MNMRCKICGYNKLIATTRDGLVGFELTCGECKVSNFTIFHSTYPFTEDKVIELQGVYEISDNKRLDNKPIMTMHKEWVAEAKCPNCGHICVHRFYEKIKPIKAFCELCVGYFEVDVKIVKGKHNGL